jgi:hypothetical protein
MTILRFACQVTCRSQSQNNFPVSASMFNIAQFRKFDLLLLIDVMTHHVRVRSMPLARRPANHFEYAVGVAHAGAEEPGTKGHGSCFGLDLHFA